MLRCLWACTMRARTYGIFLLTLSSWDTKAQQQPFPTWAEDPTWSVLECVYGIGFWCNTEVFAFTGSLPMCGHTYSVLSSASDTAYFRNDGQRTLFRRSTDCLAKEYLIYDYSIEVGDTIYAGLNMAWTSTDTAMFVLQAIDTVQLSGTERRRFLLKYDRCNNGDLQVYSTMHWIEGVGSGQHPFYPLACICDFCETSHMLLCLDSGSVQLYQDTIFRSCDTTFTNVGIGEPTDPGTGGLTIVEKGSTITVMDPSNLRSAQVRIVDLTGRVRSIARAGDPPFVFDTSGLSSGVYLVVLSDAGGRDRAARWAHSAR